MCQAFRGREPLPILMEILGGPGSNSKRAFWRITVLPNRVIRPECRRAASGKRMPPDQSPPRTDHSGWSPHKARDPGVKQILRDESLETPLAGGSARRAARPDVERAAAGIATAIGRCVGSASSPRRRQTVVLERARNTR